MVEVGRIGRPHGIRGEVTFLPTEGAADMLASSVALYLESGDVLRVVSMRRGSGDRLLLRLEGVESREQATSMTGRAVYVRREDLPEPEAGWYIGDLVGLEVLDSSGRRLGRVTGLLPTGGVEVLEIEGELGSWMLPATEPLVLDVDLDGGCMTVDPPEGLLPGTEGV